MNKTELVAAVAESTGVSKKETAAVIDATFEKIAATIAEGDKVQLIGFGTFVAAIVDFILIAFVVFLIIKAANKAGEKKRLEAEAKAAAEAEAKAAAEAEAPKAPTTEELLAQILEELKKQ